MNLFDSPHLLSKMDEKLIDDIWKKCVVDILAMTTLASSGHPGGSLSSLHLMLLLLTLRRIALSSDNDDKLIISQGHISPCIYSLLVHLGVVDREDVLTGFRLPHSPFSGHLEKECPAISWGTGNLGQGLSAGVGLALAQKIKNQTDAYTWVLMGDGEQQKGQISEARRVAFKEKLGHLVAILDVNHFQIGGATQEIMPQNIKKEYLTAGWEVLDIDGHDVKQIFQSYRRILSRRAPTQPVCIFARTIMGYGVPVMENRRDYHGKALSDSHFFKFLETFPSPLPLDLPRLKQKRKAFAQNVTSVRSSLRKPSFSLPSFPHFIPAPATTYSPDTLTDNRSAYGKALQSIASVQDKLPVMAISCDLEESVKMNLLRKDHPSFFCECGIQEHHSATMAGALSTEDILVFFSTFGIFGLDEVYNQQRLNSFNYASLKTVCTHIGINVGEDGPTHHCLDYVSLVRNLPSSTLFIPADPNQTDHIIRYVASVLGNTFVGMGRSKVPVITKEGSPSEPFYDQHYKFVPGQADILREGDDFALFSYGNTLPFVLQAHERLLQDGIRTRLVNFSSLAPLDDQFILDMARQYKHIFVYEDHYSHSGLGSLVHMIIGQHNLLTRVHTRGIDCFSLSGSCDQLYKLHQLDDISIYEHVKKEISIVS